MTKFAQVLWSPTNPNKFIKFDIGDGNNDINLYNISKDRVRTYHFFTNFNILILFLGLMCTLNKYWIVEK